MLREAPDRAVRCRNLSVNPAELAGAPSPRKTQTDPRPLKRPPH